MLATFAEASRALDEPDLQHKYLILATRGAEFLLDALRPEGRLRRSWRQGKVTHEVFLEDYAALILGLVELYQTDFQTKWFTSAQQLVEEMIELFGDPNGGFFDTSINNKELLLRPKDLQDSATPSGNALACEMLLRLVAYQALRVSTSFGRWLSVADFALSNVKQIAVVYEKNQEQAQELLQTIQSVYRPNTVVAVSSYPPLSDAPPLLLDRAPKGQEATAYVCEGFICKLPVTSALELQKQLEN